MTTPVQAVGTVSPSAQAAAAAATGGQTTQAMLNPQAFLQLLVAQLQYQDPSNPVDTSSFMNQTAMLSQVQTMNTMSSTLTALVSAQQTQAATSMIGKSITYVDATGAKATGVVTGATLGSTGASVKVGTATVPLTNVQEVSAGS
jgi:flagellar basal-body rod modification protein FlgD